MPSALDELQSRVRDSMDIGWLTHEIADILRKFETEKQPVIYDQERDFHYHRFAVKQHSPQEPLLWRLGFLDDTGQVYDWNIYVLNARAREMYEKLKKEGYYSEATASKPAEQNCEAIRRSRGRQARN